MPRSIRVLLLCSEPRCEKLSAALCSEGFEISVADAPLPEHYACEIVVTDHSDFSRLPHRLRLAISRGLVGLIVIDAPCGGDVVLPRDWTPREIQLACRLLYEIVRLRRNERRGQGVRRELLRLAHQDPLTHLPNRRRWDREIDERLSSAPHEPVALALLDIDDFKRVNATLGHPVGDRVLAAVGRALAESIRMHDLAARIGGDEFGLLIIGTEPPHVPAIVERVRRAAGEAASREAAQPISLSAGVAMAQGGDATRLIVAADQALREAKAAGRNQTRCPAGFRS